MHQMKRFFCLALLVGPTMWAAAEPTPYRPPRTVPMTGIGFRGDGTGVLADSKPPTVWDEATGQNILWKAPLPNWGLSCPVPVGNHVLVMCEPSWVPGTPGCTWPELLCFDTDTGALVWRKVVDPMLAFPEVSAEQRRRVTEGLAYSHSLYRKAYQVTGAIAERGGATNGSPELAKANEELAPLGLRLDQVRMSYGQLRYLRFGEPLTQRLKELNGLLGKYGIVRYNTWDDQGLARVGTCFPTPVSDGERVYVMTVHGTVACYAVATGHLLWCQSAGYNLPRHHFTMESPRLYGDLLLTSFCGYYPGQQDVLHQAQAWDKKTGALRWKTDLPLPTSKDEKIKELFKAVPWYSRGGASPSVLKVGNTPLLLTWSGNVLRLPDGKRYDAKIGPALATWGVDPASATIFSDISADGPGPRYGLELSMAADELKVNQRWLLGRGALGGPSMVFHDGRLFWSKVQLDPATGEPLNQGANREKTPRTSPESRHVILVANGHVYGLREEKTKGKDGTNQVTGVGEVYTLEGKLVASNVLTTAPRTGADWTEKWQAQGAARRSFSYGCPFNIGGDRIYIRSEEWLYCIGPS